MEELILEYEKAQQEVNRLFIAISSISDSFRYISNVRSYGSVMYREHNNQFAVQHLCNQYDGEHGIVDVYTTNSKHSITTCGDVIILTEEELQNLHDRKIYRKKAVSKI